MKHAGLHTRILTLVAATSSAVVLLCPGSAVAQPSAVVLGLTGGGVGGAAVTVPTGVAVTAAASIDGLDALTTGTISYGVFTDSACQTLRPYPYPTEMPVQGGVVPPSIPVAFNAPGTYYWQARFTDDADPGNPIWSQCGLAVATVQQPNVQAVIQVNGTASAASSAVRVSSPALRAACGTLTFETFAARALVNDPMWSRDAVDLALDADANATVVAVGTRCTAGTFAVNAAQTAAPYLRATASVTVGAPATLRAGLVASPSSEVLTGNTPASGDSTASAVLLFSTDPVYAGQTVRVSSPQLAARCPGPLPDEPNLRWQSNGFDAPYIAASSADAVIDTNGNAALTVFGIHCSAGRSTITATVRAGTFPSTTATFTTLGPRVLLSGKKPALGVTVSPQKVTQA